MFTPITNKTIDKGSLGFTFNVQKIKSQKEKRQSFTGLIITIACLLACSFVIQNSEALENTTASNFFLPTDLNFFYRSSEINAQNLSLNHNSPLSYSHNLSDNAASQWLASFARGLDNEELFQTARNLKTNDMTSSQRGHNYRWIQQGNSDSSRSSKDLIRKIISTTVKTYWNQWRQQSFSTTSPIPDIEGKGKLHWQQQEIDYRLNVTGNGIKLMFKIDFY